ncbi:MULTISPECIES: transcriptional regulator SplA domain-containing protein [Bacillaceae]|uniref:transcriptional regulator SplA domain-containing protein n=1 Tax=Bacillaceae TaxID=186817 RepID=UPI001E65938C|nr:MULTISPECIES: transcriptional regulator SplA domain-containing protein [Bacillaceae]MCE4047831.1 transcriptional regulator [Bacillus sp. Au-Bac7]MCM3033241.1 transcriptional regulator [Niallia sp. MER 6]MDL0434855.1 transcriptional regulator SplA domain-containing protein [Niallia sp. SS-2023]UPO89327.1 transcriptional regulator [Niallia sp. Man26]
MDTLDPKDLQLGDEVYVIYHNPHTPSVSNVKPAEIVQHPKDPNALALFLNDTFHTIEDDDALFHSESDAENAYNQMYQDEIDNYF